MKILIPGKTEYTIGSVPVTILATGLNYRTYEHPEPLDTSVEIDGLIYLVRRSELTVTEGPGELREFKVPRVNCADTRCNKAGHRMDCKNIGCSECIYDYLWRNHDENS